MRVRALAPAAALAYAACAAASASFGTFYMASGPGLDLFRRDAAPYQPNSTVCTEPGNSCGQCCGAKFQECPSRNDKETHCFRPETESCCVDHTGKSCDKGFSCASDGQKNWCCPQNMDLDHCALSFGLAKGALHEPVPYSPPAPVSSVAPPPPPAPVTTSETPTTTSALPVFSAPANTTAVVVQAPAQNATVGHGPTQPAVAPYIPSQMGPSSNLTISGAASAGVSSLVLVLAGVVAIL